MTKVIHSNDLITSNNNTNEKTIETNWIDEANAWLDKANLEMQVMLAQTEKMLEETKQMHLHLEQISLKIDQSNKQNKAIESDPKAKKISKNRYKVRKDFVAEFWTLTKVKYGISYN